MKKLLNVNGRLLDLSTPAVMGILNITPDSFYDGGTLDGIPAILHRAGAMVSEGATILDVGAQSTRPGASFLTADQEWQRLEAPLREVRSAFPGVAISVDTFHSTVAERAVSAGADIINDISGGTLDVEMFRTIARLKTPYILMHIQGTPQTMQAAPAYGDVVRDVFDHLLKRSLQLKELGVTDIIVDPGFGFGKTLEQNFALLKSLSFFREAGYPVLAGLSRKSMINRVLHTRPEEALNGTTVLNVLALTGGASILRVHDVREAVEAVRLFQYWKNA